MQRYKLRQGKLRPDPTGEWVPYAEAEHLEVITEKLSKTADGVPVYQDMTAYARYGNRITWVQILCIQRNNRVYCNVQHGTQHKSLPLDWIYSTREVAEAANRDSA